MNVVRVDMFGAAPGRGSALDVLLPAAGPDAAEQAAAHARGTDADETVLVTGCDPDTRTFTSRIFNAAGETPFATHSLAGSAACLVAGGHLPAGDLARDGQRLWTDGDRVRVPFTGPAVHEELAAGHSLVQPYGGVARAVGVGRRFTLVRVGQDPRALPAPDPASMREQGLTDLTLHRWDPAGRQVLARTFAPGFEIAEDAGCLPVAAALAVAALVADPGGPVTVTQVTARGTESVFTCTGAIRDGVARIEVAGRVWVGVEAVRRVS